jgi:hypothetical protein
LRNRFCIQPESSDLVGVVCFFTVGDTDASTDKFIAAFETLSAERGNQAGLDSSAEFRSSGAIITPGRQAMSPRDAFFAKTRTVETAESVGEISAELVIPYPPGIPVLAPGDIIDADKIEFLLHGTARGMHLSGPADPHLKTINVVADVDRSF